MEETVSISKSKLAATGALILLILAALLVFGGPFIDSYSAMLIVSFAAILTAGYYVHSKKHELDDMCCMMVGMTFAMTAGFAAGSLIAIPTGNFLLGAIAGTAVGLMFGYFFGKIGGNPLSRMEGVMAAPMGGTMGAMIGIMMVPYDLSIYVKFFFFVVVLLMFEIMNVVKTHTGSVVPSSVKALFAAIVLVGFAATFMMAFAVPGSADYVRTNTVESSTAQAAAAGGTRAVMNGGVQEVSLSAEPYSYEPSTIIAKKGVPLKINFAADQRAGCTRALVFPDFKVSKTLQPGGSDTIQFTPESAGTYGFRCSMGMFRGKLIVEN